MGKKDKKKKGSLKKVIIFLGITHPIEALLAARKARKLGLKPCRWFLATLAFGVFASSRMKKPVTVEVEVEEAPKGRKEKKAKKEKKAADTKIVIEVIEEVAEVKEEAVREEKARKGKKSKRSKKSK